MDSKYTLTVGLEIHAELKTRTKMFCDSKNDPEASEPNMNICPVCMAHPGTLPVINKEAVKSVIKVGLAMGGMVADFTEFDRKNYFYPDIPKGYQISQYKYPIVSGGELAGVQVTRVHLEEDTATSKHDRGDYTLIDFNRAGVPLMELVTEPVIHSPEAAAAFAKELQLLLRYLDVSNANLEKGEMRVEANISVSAEEGKLGTKCEVKNLNSFKSVERAIAYEMQRHIDALEKGEKILQETRGWDEAKQVTFSQRLKEDSHDYRYFPDPDLPKLKLSEAFDMQALKAALPELPARKRERIIDDFQLKPQAAEIYVTDFFLSGFFDEVTKLATGDISLINLASNYILSDLSAHTKELPGERSFNKIKPDGFLKLIRMNKDGKISSHATKVILSELFYNGGDPEKIAEEKGLLQKSDEGELKSIIQKSIEANPKVVEEYKAGKDAALMFFVGQVMKETKGSANPAVAQKLIKELLA